MRTAAFAFMLRARAEAAPSFSCGDGAAGVFDVGSGAGAEPLPVVSPKAKEYPVSIMRQESAAAAARRSISGFFCFRSLNILIFKALSSIELK